MHSFGVWRTDLLTLLVGVFRGHLRTEFDILGTDFDDYLGLLGDFWTEQLLFCIDFKCFLSRRKELFWFFFLPELASLNNELLDFLFFSFFNYFFSRVKVDILSFFIRNDSSPFSFSYPIVQV